MQEADLSGKRDVTERTDMISELQIGVITQTHGIRGEVKVFPTTDDPRVLRS